jgi:hypothetical protein
MRRRDPEREEKDANSTKHRSIVAPGAGSSTDPSVQNIPRLVTLMLCTSTSFEVLIKDRTLHDF